MVVFLLAYSAECFLCTCSWEFEAYVFTFRDFWSWDSFFNCISIVAFPCMVVGGLYGFFSKKKISRNKVETMIIVIITAVAVFIIMKYLLQWAMSNL